MRNVPAALYKALGGFATNGVNMTKLESYMENGAFTATFFYAEVARRGDKTVAAIASSLAGELYGLKSLRANIEDAEHNTTRFLVMAREPINPDAASAVVTTFVFRVRNVPAALYKALGGFATNGVNMTKLESYMVGGNFFATQFYADVEGHPDDRALVFALEELAFFSKELTVLGVYPAHPFRDTFKEEKD